MPKNPKPSPDTAEAALPPPDCSACLGVEVPPDAACCPSCGRAIMVGEWRFGKCYCGHDFSALKADAEGIEWTDLYGLEVWAGGQMQARIGEPKSKRETLKAFERSVFRNHRAVTLRMVRYGYSGGESRDLEYMTIKEEPNSELRDAVAPNLNPSQNDNSK